MQPRSNRFSVTVSATLIAVIGVAAVSSCAQTSRATASVPTVVPVIYSGQNYNDARGQGGKATGERPPADPLRYAYYGTPITTGVAGTELSMLTNTGYLAGYDFERHAPRWVAYRLFVGGPAGSNSDSKKAAENTVAHDVRLGAAPAAADPKHPERAPTTETYFGEKSGTIALPLAPRAAIAANYGADAGAQTLFNSALVAVPAVKGESAWAALSARESAWAELHKELWIVAGTIGADPAHPEALFKVYTTVQQGRTAVQAFIIPVGAVVGDRGRDQQGDELARYLVSAGEVERRTGLTFFNDYHDLYRDTEIMARLSVPVTPWSTTASEPAVSKR